MAEKETKAYEETDITKLVAEPLTWEKLNEMIPVAKPDMTEDELRKICVDFMNLALSFPWTPSKTFPLSRSKKIMEKGKVYGGHPYVACQISSLYRFLEYYNQETGVLEVERIGDDVDHIGMVIGNQCSGGTFWGWARVTNAIRYGGTSDISEKTGCYKIGEYFTGSCIKDYYHQNMSTIDLCADNGEQVIWEAYAKVKPADGIFQYQRAGHVRMVTQCPKVVRNEDGTINGQESIFYYQDQQGSWTNITQSNGVELSYQGGCHSEASFETLFKGGYFPFSIPELCGKKKVDLGKAGSTLKKDTATIAELKEADVTGNYPIAGFELLVEDENGAQLYRKYGLTDNNNLNYFSYPMKNAVDEEALKAFIGKTVVVKTRISNGELLESWRGVLAAE